LVRAHQPLRQPGDMSWMLVLGFQGSLTCVRWVYDTYDCDLPVCMSPMCACAQLLYDRVLTRPAVCVSHHM
jgi:hypothetical protein